MYKIDRMVTRNFFMNYTISKVLSDYYQKNDFSQIPEDTTQEEAVRKQMMNWYRTQN